MNRNNRASCLSIPVYISFVSHRRERGAVGKDGKEESAASVRFLDEMAKQCKRHYDNGTSGESSSPFAPSVADGLLAVLRMGYGKIPSRNTRVG